MSGSSVWRSFISKIINVRKLPLCAAYWRILRLNHIYANWAVRNEHALCHLLHLLRLHIEIEGKRYWIHATCDIGNGKRPICDGFARALRLARKYEVMKNILLRHFKNKMALIPFCLKMMNFSVKHYNFYRLCKFYINNILNNLI